MTSEEESPRQGYLSRLRKLLATHFDEEELRTLCFDLGVNHDSLRGEGKEGKARELVSYLERRGRVSKLVDVCSKQRPNVDWVDLSQAPGEPPPEHRSSPFSFIYGRPVWPGEFLGREAELRTIFNRLYGGESTAVVGARRSGKTSLLLQLADGNTQKAYLGDDAQKLTICLLDLHPIANDLNYTPATFWTEALERLQGHASDDATATRLLAEATLAGYARRSLERLFEHLGTKRRRLVLLLDEFEQLLCHPNFQDATFFAFLRSMTTRTGGLALVTTSGLSVTEMNEQSRKRMGEVGSPYFNHLVDVRLHPFDERTVETLLGRAGDALSRNDRRFVRRVAGRYPFLLQAMAATLIEASENDDRHAGAAERFYELISHSFDNMWCMLDDRARTTAIVLSLMELGDRIVGGSFVYDELEQANDLGFELQELANKYGLAEQVRKDWAFDNKHLLSWRDEKWTVVAQAFTWWVYEAVIARTRHLEACEEWLKTQSYLCMLSQGQWNGLISAVRNVPKWTIRSFRDMARALFSELGESG